MVRENILPVVAVQRGFWASTVSFVDYDLSWKAFIRVLDDRFVGCGFVISADTQVGEQTARIGGADGDGTHSRSDRQTEPDDPRYLRLRYPVTGPRGLRPPGDPSSTLRL